MTRPRAARFALLALLATSALVATGCATQADPGEGAPSVPASAVPSSPVATPDPTETSAPVAEATCDNIINATILADLQKQGWKSTDEPMMIGDTELSDGISCTWTNDAQAGGNIFLFGWSPITPAQTTELERRLESDGWTAEPSDEGTFITQDPNTAITVDTDGYGQTYLFGDGWVIVSDTKQNLTLVERRSA